MDPITQQTVTAAAGAGGDSVYVDDVFSTYLYDGTGAAQSINNGIDLAGEGGLVWLKSRTASSDHLLFDTARTLGYKLSSNDTGAEANFTVNFTSFNVDGFGIAGNGTSINSSSHTYASWTFRKAPGFFDVVTYTGNGTAGRTVSHNLGSVPGFIVVKELSTASNWVCYHRSTGNDYALYLNKSDAADGPNTASWNQTSPTSTEFTVGVDGYHTNDTNITYVAYIFAHDDASFGTDEDESIIKCGSYTGNSSTAGNSISLGWEPQWLMIKSTGTAASNTGWHIYDNMRGVVTNGDDQALTANLSSEENGSGVGGGVDLVDFNATGFTVKSNNYAVNNSSFDYIYMAIRRPHKPPTVGTEVFATQDGRSATNGTASQNTYTSGFPVDLIMRHTKASDSTRSVVFDRLRGEQYLLTHETAAEASGDFIQFDNMDGVHRSTVSANTGLFAHMFKRAPGFMDVVAYTGTGSTRTVGHNLGVAPELLIVKRRDYAEAWDTYVASLGNTKFLELNNTDGEATSGIRWNNTSPTSSVFTVATHSTVNTSGGSYIAYLFATLPGISKVGSYIGNSGAQDIDCGFTNGARFVMIKRTDSDGNWFVWDTAQGIVSGNDPYLKLNTNQAQNSSGDFIDIDTAGSGFKIDTTYDPVNANGGSFIFLAIA